MPTAIVYYSQHHENTKKLIDAIKAKDPDIRLVDITKTRVEDLSKYDRIGIASGIYFGKFNKYTKELKAIAEEKGCKYLGEYGCFGFDTFGPFKLMGGIQKNHPTEDEIAGAVHFYETLI